MNELAPRKGLSASEIEAVIDRIITEATLAEKVAMMSGRGFFEQYRESNRTWGAHAYRAGGGIERLGVPAFYFTDGPRGVSRGSSTCFPCAIARGASFDTDLELRIGEAIGIEARAQGANLYGGVCVNLLRHPAWGRAQETYGEDSFLLGEMGSALGTGVQAHNVAATIKHFALNSMENARFKVDVQLDERTLHEVYLPHFKRGIDAGIATVMSAYNKMNGEYTGQNTELLTDILRGEWGFSGFVHSDWVQGVYHLYAAAAGLDIENPEPQVYGDNLVKAVEDGRVAPAVIDRACRRILRVLYRFACAEDPLADYSAGLVASPAHTALALESAQKSAVLLENNGVLPLDRSKVRKLALLGKLASIVNTGDSGSSRVASPYVVTALEGLQRYLGEAAVIQGTEDDLDQASAAAAQADAVVVVVGYTAQDEGEYVPGGLTLGADEKEERKAAGEVLASKGGDRLDLRLRPAHVALIEAAARSGKPVVVVIVAGSAVLVEEWRDTAGAILQTFYSGMEGGTALARLLFGEANPSGRLPFSVARTADDYPFFDREADAIEYGYWHGYAKLEHDGIEARYPFGHGLSYTSFSHRALDARVTGAAIEATVAVRNDGPHPGDEVVQLYVGYPGTVTPRAAKTLQGFARVHLDPGETGIVRLSVPLANLRYRDPHTHGWKLESGEHRIIVARSAADPAPLAVTISL
ncbi:MAG: glycosyl hydrolase [Alphaproteobacteria bacterium HGW-Alphaproteobacteria-5]|jgi:beta-glucosidase|nr:MAG: glycosyl hydrolase [Alphaproteobacteria bacterium HGW-Alphaproteobacteria-5]